jgi:hypothetical protein
VLRRVKKKKKKKKSIHVIKRIMTNWTDYILLGNCLLKQAVDGKIEGRIEVMVRRGRRSKQLLDYLKE